MISFIGFFILVVLNATMDTLRHHYSSSIFKNLNPKYWDPTNDWNKCITILGYHIDAWHIMKSISILIICAMLPRVLPGIWIFNNFWTNFLAYLFIYGIFFNLLYSWIYKS